MISGKADKKIFNLDKNNKEKLSEFIKPLKNIVLAGGCFDIIHFGHIAFLKSAKEIGGELVIFLESDETIKQKKGRKPIHTQEKRAQLVASLMYVDVVIALPPMKDDSEYEDLTKLIKPKYIAVTKGDKLIEKKRRHAAKIGATVKEVTDHLEGLSTSLITKYASISSS